MLKGAIYNLLVNPAAAAFLTNFSHDDETVRDIAIIVAIDTVFRIALSHTISAFKLTPNKPKTIGNLIFICSTVVTQPVSVKLAERIFHAKKPPYLNTLAYIFFGWKANLMVKDLFYCCGGG